MLRRLYRQRRRIVFLIVCVLCALALSGVESDSLRYTIKHQAGGQAGLYIGVFVAVFVVFAIAVAAALIVLLPGLRRTLECGGIAAVLLQLIQLFGPSVLPDGALAASALPFWYMGVYFVVATVVERDMFYRQGLRLRFKSTGQRRIQATQAQVWAATAPELAHVETYFSGLLMRVVPRPDLGPDMQEAHYSVGSSTSLVQIQERLDWNAPHRLHYRFEPENRPEKAPAIRGTYEMVSTARDDGATDVTVTHDYPAIGMGTWLLIWLDDLVGSEVDGLQAHLEGRRDFSTVGWAKRKIAAS